MTGNSQSQCPSALRKVFAASLSALLAFAMCIPSAALADTTGGDDSAAVVESEEPDTADADTSEGSQKASNAVAKTSGDEGDGNTGDTDTSGSEGSGSEGEGNEGGETQSDEPQSTDEPAAQPVSLASAKVALSAKTYIYDKTKHKPDTKVTINSKTLVRGTDYKVKYSNCKNVGVATVKITGKGDYTGTKTATFKIRPMGTTFRDVLTRTTTKMHIRWAVQDKQTSGYEIEYGATKSLKSGTKTVTVANPSANDTTVKCSKKKKTYYARVRTYMKVDGETYYSKWSKVLSAKPFNKTRQAKAVPVLTYHRICSDKAKKRFYGTGLAISETNFRKQMRWLSQHGYHGVSMAEFIDWYHDGAYLPKKSILITVDDGFYETYWVARPILKRYGQKATNFIIGSRTPSKTVAYNPNSSKNHYVGRDVIKEANNTLDCLKYESHTYNMHSKASRERPYLQVWSQAKINADFDKIDTTYGFSALAYPFGYCNSKAYKACKRSKDIKVAFTYKMNSAARRSSPKYRLPRFKVKGNKSWTYVMGLAGTYK